MPAISLDRTRSCGPCSVCCTRLGVGELDKRVDLDCWHIGLGGGCSVYDRRPTSCRLYTCMWLRGDLPQDLRPDRSGILVSTSRVAGVPVLFVHEARPKALDQEDSPVPMLLRQGNTLVLFSFDRRHMIVKGPDEDLKRRVALYIEEHGVTGCEEGV